jgi:hypothetical protein
MLLKYKLFLLLMFLSMIHLYILKQTNYVYDLSRNLKCNYFEIYDIYDLKRLLNKCPNKLIIDDYLPKWINIETFPEKGWGLVSKKLFKKNEIIYKAPILLYPNDGIEVISKHLGRKKISKEVHCGDMAQIYGIFSCYDIFLNHSDSPSAYHDILLLIENKHVYIVLKAHKNIPANTELTINYWYLNKYIYLTQSYISVLLRNLHIGNQMLK